MSFNKKIKSSIFLIWKFLFLQPLNGGTGVTFQFAPSLVAKAYIQEHVYAMQMAPIRPVLVFSSKHLTAILRAAPQVIFLLKKKIYCPYYNDTEASPKKKNIHDTVLSWLVVLNCIYKSLDYILD